MDLCWSIVLALLATPLAGALGLVVAYLALARRGVSEHEGRRGLLAFVLGFLPGALLGFVVVARAVWWLRRSDPEPAERFAAAVLLALVLALLAGLGGWVAGIHRAEARGISNYAGERAAYGFVWYALPALIAGAVGGFALGTVLFG
ncbi:MAG: hypothetical protein IPN34_16145 [Planctomycetes bacterium]|nr:hypothetical protein [Planctomycetota bacterium]